MDEKRRTHRLNIQLPARYRVAHPDMEFTDAVILNINVKGVCLIIDEELKLGTEVEIQVDLPDQSPLILTAHVIWVKASENQNEYATGVQVLDTMSEDASKFVRFYAAKLLNMSEGK